VSALRLLPRFSDDPDRDWVIWLHLTVAGGAAWLAYHYGLGWWAAAVGAGVFGVLMAALAQRRLFWLAAVCGTAASTALGAALGGVVAASLAAHPTRPLLAAAALPGAALGAWLGFAAYRKLFAPE
jgi:hypothetical protein